MVASQLETTSVDPKITETAATVLVTLCRYSLNKLRAQSHSFHILTSVQAFRERYGCDWSVNRHRSLGAHHSGAVDQNMVLMSSILAK
jgi:hypothetical protein